DVEIRVDARNHDVEFCKNLIAVIERAICENIHFACAEALNPMPLTDGFDLGSLRQELFRIEAVRRTAPFGVIADRMVFLPARFCRNDHFFKRVAAVAPGAMHVKIATNITTLNEHWKSTGYGQIDLVASNAQLGWNELHAERLIHAALFRARDRIASFEIQ